MSDIETAPIHLIDTNPENSVIASPDGRIFVDLVPLVNDMTGELFVRSIQAKMEGNEQDLIAYAGIAGMLKSLMNTNEFLKLQVSLEQTERNTNE